MWRTGTGPPAAGLGNDGDTYLDNASRLIYQKRAGAWVRVADLAGADGAVWHNVTGPPSSSLGKNGDFALIVGTGSAAGSVYSKSGGVWSFQVDIDGTDGTDGTDGATWYGGSGFPSSSLGVAGDFYLDQTNGRVYNKSSSTVWSFRADITGPPGQRRSGRRRDVGRGRR